MASCLQGRAAGNAEVTACHQELSTKVTSGALDAAQCQHDRLFTLKSMTKLGCDAGFIRGVCKGINAAL